MHEEYKDSYGTVTNIFDYTGDCIFDYGNDYSDGTNEGKLITEVECKGHYGWSNYIILLDDYKVTFRGVLI